MNFLANGNVVTKSGQDRKPLLGSGRLQRSAGRAGMRVIFMLLLTVAAAPVWAGWEKVGETNTRVVYIDPATVRKSGPMRRVTLMHDLKQRAPSGEMSKRTIEEHDCAGNRVRGLSGSTHSGPILDGQTLWSGRLTSEWHHIPPDSVAATAHGIVCAP